MHVKHPHIKTATANHIPGHRTMFLEKESYPLDHGFSPSVGTVLHCFLENSPQHMNEDVTAEEMHDF